MATLHCIFSKEFYPVVLTVLGELGPGQLGPGQLGPGLLGPGQLGPGQFGPGAMYNFS